MSARWCSVRATGSQPAGTSVLPLARASRKAVPRIFKRVLKELADLDNPMRSPVGSAEGEGAAFEAPGASANGKGPRPEEGPTPEASEHAARR